ncbi:MAG: TIGR04282 family arsenosugar biosynthesis glycosyltransferase [Planctomycetota bacterium]
MSPDSEEPWTGIFTKRPAAGRVKTRLVPPLGEEAAARLAQGMLDDSVERLTAAPGRHVLAFAPEEDEAWFRARYPALALVPQRGAGLGERMASFFETALASAPACVMTGSDQPLVSGRRLEEAHTALAHDADLVLGPDRGGGYYLVGLARSAPKELAPLLRALFSEAPMSTPSVFEHTLETARRLGLRTQRLSVGLDVDTDADLEQLELVLRDTPALAEARHTREALRELGRLA